MDFKQGTKPPIPTPDIPVAALPKSVRPAKEQRTGYIYVIQGTPGTPIKVGFTLRADDAQQRALQIQTGHPYPLQVIATAPGTYAQEHAIHRALKEERLMGEWFEMSERAQLFVEMLAKHGIEDALRAASTLLPPSSTPPGWEKLVIVENAIGKVFALRPANLVFAARRAGNGPPFLEVPIRQGQTGRFYRLDQLKEWLDNHGIPYRIDRAYWASQVHALERRSAAPAIDTRHVTGTSGITDSSSEKETQNQ